MNDSPTALGRNLINYRTKRKLSLRQFAAECGINDKTLWQLEKKDIKPHGKTLSQLLSYFQLPEDVLLSDMDETDMDACIKRRTAMIHSEVPSVTDFIIRYVTPLHKEAEPILKSLGYSFAYQWGEPYDLKLLQQCCEPYQELDLIFKTSYEEIKAQHTDYSENQIANTIIFDCDDETSLQLKNAYITYNCHRLQKVWTKQVATKPSLSSLPLVVQLYKNESLVFTMDIGAYKEFIIDLIQTIEKKILSV